MPDHEESKDNGIVKADTNRRFALFMNHVDHETIKPLCEWILACNLDQSESRPSELTLIINSPGGTITDAFALIDMMNGSRIPIRTVGIGLIASAGLMIFMNGQKGYRSLTPNTSILSHQFSGMAFGKQHELLAVQREFALVQDRIVKHFKRCTGLTEKEVKDKLLPPTDQWMFADQALKLGICDRIQDMGQFCPVDQPKYKTKSKIKRTKKTKK
jgi:ATP-dependent Clp protease, protease subunit